MSYVLYTSSYAVVVGTKVVVATRVVVASKPSGPSASLSTTIFTFTSSPVDHEGLGMVQE